MPSAALRLFDGQASGLDELGGSSPAIVNCVIGGAEVERRTLRTRPGITTWNGFPTTVPNASPVTGMYPFSDNWLVYMTEDRKLWAADGNGGYLALSDATAATQVQGSLRPVFTRTPTRCLVVGGGAPQMWDGAGLSRLLGGSPPRATHIDYLAQRLVVNNYDRSGQITLTDAPSGATPDPYESTWTNVFTAEADADPVVAIYANTNEQFLFGTRTMQVLVPDATNKYAVARTLSIGCSAPYSIVSDDDAFAWLDHQGRIVASNGRGIEYISSPVIDDTLAKINTVADCWGFRARLGAYDLDSWIFPTDNRGFCFESNSKTWSEWRSYSGGGWAAPAMRSYVYWPEKKLHLVGLADGSIGQLSLDVATESGAAIPVKMWTGFDDHGVRASKLCLYLELVFRGGTGTPGGVAPIIEVSWRDNLGPFCQPLRMSIGNAGEYGVTASLGPLGTYVSRQWRLSYSSSVPLTLVKAVESYSIQEQ